MNESQEFSSLGSSKLLRLYWPSFCKYSNIAVTFRYRHNLWQIMTYQHIKGCCERFSGLKLLFFYVDKHCFDDSTPDALTSLTATLTLRAWPWQLKTLAFECHSVEWWYTGIPGSAAIRFSGWEDIVITKEWRTDTQGDSNTPTLTSTKDYKYKDGSSRLAAI